MGSSKLEKIVFVPLCSGSIIEARIIWCLGMDEGSFPRDDVRSSVCEMSKSKNSDYYPPKADEDRFLFLEMLMKAKDYLIFSFQRVHPEDGKNQGPSLLVEELDHYLQKRGVSKGMIKTDHPAFPFDQTYFTKDASVKKWSEADFLAAQAHYFRTLAISLFLCHARSSCVNFSRMKVLNWTLERVPACRMLS